MTTRTINERARDVELVADAITKAVKIVLPAMVRQEVEMQLSHAGKRDELSQAPAGKSPGMSRELGADPRLWLGTLPRPGKP